MKQEEPYLIPELVMYAEEFERRLRIGVQLVILDDLVLDVSEFALYHPGGKFVI
jgi:NAD(P)H-flavin reductase